jgi:cysteinyl-tRNA synthetase
MSGQKEEFRPREEGKVNMFVCGPTVYDFSHIGHARTYIIYDVIARYLRQFGYEVFYLQNITDIDDKIIDRAKNSGRDPVELSKEFTQYHHTDMKALNINSVNHYAPATEFIPEIISQIKRLLSTGHAYLIENDGYYFDLTKFHDYGKLSGRTTEQAEDATSRIDESVNKRNKGDFALWKFSKPDEPFWETELGRGRPGWHIEDTAITEKYFGPQYDLHGGALELIFPHHEAEIAQMEAISGKSPMVKYWVHSGVLTIDGKKMSKSLGNFTTISDLLKHHAPEVVRFMSLSAYYRTPLDYNEKIMEQSEAGVRRIYEFVQKLHLTTKTREERKPQNKEENYEERIEEARHEFLQAMDDDFNTPRAYGAIFDLIRDLNIALTGNSLDKNSVEKTREFIEEINVILGIVPSKQEKIPDEVSKLVEKREKFREEKNWKEADNIRIQIQELGYKVEDTIYGPLIRSAR